MRALTGGSNLQIPCPDWELNLQPFSVWDDAPTNEPPGQGSFHFVGGVL